MNQNWERVESLFLQALDLHPEDRARFLDAECADNAELRQEVESLIAHDSASPQRIAEALEGTARSLVEIGSDQARDQNRRLRGTKAHRLRRYG